MLPVEDDVLPAGVRSRMCLRSSATMTLQRLEERKRCCQCEQSTRRGNSLVSSEDDSDDSLASLSEFFGLTGWHRSSLSQKREVNMSWGNSTPEPYVISEDSSSSECTYSKHDASHSEKRKHQEQLKTFSKLRQRIDEESSEEERVQTEAAVESKPKKFVVKKTTAKSVSQDSSSAQEFFAINNYPSPHISETSTSPLSDAPPQRQKPISHKDHGSEFPSGTPSKTCRKDSQLSIFEKYSSQKKKDSYKPPREEKTSDSRNIGRKSRMAVQNFAVAEIYSTETDRHSQSNTTPEKDKGVKHNGKSAVRKRGKKPSISPVDTSSSSDEDDSPVTRHRQRSKRTVRGLTRRKCANAWPDASGLGSAGGTSTNTPLPMGHNTPPAVSTESDSASQSVLHWDPKLSAVDAAGSGGIREQIKPGEPSDDSQSSVPSRSSRKTTPERKNRSSKPKSQKEKRQPVAVFTSQSERQKTCSIVEEPTESDVTVLTDSESSNVTVCADVVPDSPGSGMSPDHCHTATVTDNTQDDGTETEEENSEKTNVCPVVKKGREKVGGKAAVLTVPEEMCSSPTCDSETVKTVRQARVEVGPRAQTDSKEAEDGSSEDYVSKAELEDTQLFENSASCTGEKNQGSSQKKFDGKEVHAGILLFREKFARRKKSLALQSEISDTCPKLAALSDDALSEKHTASDEELLNASLSAEGNLISRAEQEGVAVAASDGSHLPKPPANPVGLDSVPLPVSEAMEVEEGTRPRKRSLSGVTASSAEEPVKRSRHLSGPSSLMPPLASRVRSPLQSCPALASVKDDGFPQQADPEPSSKREGHVHGSEASRRITETNGFEHAQTAMSIKQEKGEEDDVYRPGKTTTSQAPSAVALGSADVSQPSMVKVKIEPGVDAAGVTQVQEDFGGYSQEEHIIVINDSDEEDFSAPAKDRDKLLPRRTSEETNDSNPSEIDLFSDENSSGAEFCIYLSDAEENPDDGHVSGSSENHVSGLSDDSRDGLFRRHNNSNHLSHSGTGEPQNTVASFKKLEEVAGLNLHEGFACDIVVKLEPADAEWNKLPPDSAASQNSAGNGRSSGGGAPEPSSATGSQQGFSHLLLSEDMKPELLSRYIVDTNISSNISPLSRQVSFTDNPPASLHLPRSIPGLNLSSIKEEPRGTEDAAYGAETQPDHPQARPFAVPGPKPFSAIKREELHGSEAARSVTSRAAEGNERGDASFSSQGFVPAAGAFSVHASSLERSLTASECPPAPLAGSFEVDEVCVPRKSDGAPLRSRGHRTVPELSSVPEEEKSWRMDSSEEEAYGSLTQVDSFGRGGKRAVSSGSESDSDTYGGLTQVDRGSSVVDAYSANTQVDSRVQLPRKRSRSPSENDAYMASTQVDSRVKFSRRRSSSPSENDAYMALTQVDSRVKFSRRRSSSPSENDAYMASTQVDSRVKFSRRRSSSPSENDAYMASTQVDSRVKFSRRRSSSPSENDAYMASTQVDSRVKFSRRRSSSPSENDAYMASTQVDMKPPPVGKDGGKLPHRKVDKPHLPASSVNVKLASLYEDISSASDASDEEEDSFSAATQVDKHKSSSRHRGRSGRIEPSEEKSNPVIATTGTLGSKCETSAGVDEDYLAATQVDVVTRSNSSVLAPQRSVQHGDDEVDEQDDPAYEEMTQIDMSPKQRPLSALVRRISSKVETERRLKEISFLKQPPDAKTIRQKLEARRSKSAPKTSNVDASSVGSTASRSIHSSEQSRGKDSEWLSKKVPSKRSSSTDKKEPRRKRRKKGDCADGEGMTQRIQAATEMMNKRFATPRGMLHREKGQQNVPDHDNMEDAEFPNTQEVHDKGFPLLNPTSLKCRTKNDRAVPSSTGSSSSSAPPHTSTSSSAPSCSTKSSSTPSHSGKSSSTPSNSDKSLSTPSSSRKSSSKASDSSKSSSKPSDSSKSSSKPSDSSKSSSKPSNSSKSSSRPSNSSRSPPLPSSSSKFSSMSSHSGKSASSMPHSSKARLSDSDSRNSHRGHDGNDARRSSAGSSPIESGEKSLIPGDKEGRTLSSSSESCKKTTSALKSDARDLASRSSSSETVDAGRMISGSLHTTMTRKLCVILKKLSSSDAHRSSTSKVSPSLASETSLSSSRSSDSSSSKTPHSSSSPTDHSSLPSKTSSSSSVNAFSTSTAKSSQPSSVKSSSSSKTSLSSSSKSSSSSAATTPSSKPLQAVSFKPCESFPSSSSSSSRDSSLTYKQREPSASNPVSRLSGSSQEVPADESRKSKNDSSKMSRDVHGKRDVLSSVGCNFSEKGSDASVNSRAFRPHAPVVRSSLSDGRKSTASASHAQPEASSSVAAPRSLAETGGLQTALAPSMPPAWTPSVLNSKTGKTGQGSENRNVYTPVSNVTKSMASLHEGPSTYPRGSDSASALTPLTLAPMHGRERPFDPRQVAGQTSATWGHSTVSAADRSRRSSSDQPRVASERPTCSTPLQVPSAAIPSRAALPTSSSTMERVAPLASRSAVLERWSSSREMMQKIPLNAGSNTRDPRLTRLTSTACLEGSRTNAVPTKSLKVAHFYSSVLRWNASWLEEQDKPKNDGKPPPVTKQSYPLLDVYDNLEDYQSIMMNLLLLETWEDVSRDWRNANNHLASHFFLLVSCSPDEATNLVRLKWIGLLRRNSGRNFQKGTLAIVNLKRERKMQTGAASAQITMTKKFGFIEEVQDFQPGRRRLYPLLEKLPIAKENNLRLVSVTMLIQDHVELKPQVEKLMEIQPLSSIVTRVRQCLALQALPKSCLCQDILHPNKSSNFVLPATPSSSPPSQVLNEEQAQVVSRVTEAVRLQKQRFICLLQGPPGTGKSHTIIATIARIHEGNPNARICLAAPSNNAIDELVRRLIRASRRDPRLRNLDFVRIGRADRSGSDVAQYTLDTRARSLWKRELEMRQSSAVPKSVRDQISRVETRLQKKMDEQKACKLEAESLKLQGDIKRLRMDLRRLKGENSGNPPQSNHMPRGEESRLYQQILLKAHVVCGTLNSFGHERTLCHFKSHFQRQNQAPVPCFSCAIVDEATQALEIECLIPLQYNINTLFLVGDPEQLSATCLSKKAEELKFGMSLFERCFNFFLENKQEKHLHMLKVQHRMNPEVCHFPNKHIYENKLYNHSSVCERSQTQTLKPYLLFDLDSSQEHCSQPGSISNEVEAEFTAALCRTILTKGNVGPGQVAVICPYRRQLVLIQGKLRQREMPSIEVGTVDSFQGREKDVIIISCVRANSSSGGIGFLDNRKRMNVALTRARQAVYIIGHLSSLKSKLYLSLQSALQGSGSCKESKALHHPVSFQTKATRLSGKHKDSKGNTFFRALQR